MNLLATGKLTFRPVHFKDISQKLLNSDLKGRQMKRVVYMLFALFLLLGVATAQNVGDNSVYFVTYYSNANTSGAPNAYIRFVNDGDHGTGVAGDLWAAFYIFDDSQELTECCACVVTPDGVLSEDVTTELTATPLTGRLNTRGVIKVISSSSSDPTAPVPVTGLRGTATHTQRFAPTSGAYFVTETAMSDANLAPAEEALLGQLCYFADTLLSGVGCTCTPEDHDF